ncbi:hypothetical protein [Saccharospirillum salsuginis]|uniref:Uncharacterized protein n=1 Tax=Saccharospirillum salsuginis TaxID=418750 RepID=A0A918K0I6_9GAMM|nr:hypothetical protein [Saccharospirillum salsuginis]GGX41888.1 hypothetical protein GCM10007392_06010 [Saccharospirillum salsuginis]
MTARHTPKKVSKDRIYRAVASSTAIETGGSIKAIEQRLKANLSKFKDLKLAD